MIALSVHREVCEKMFVFHMQELYELFFSKCLQSSMTTCENVSCHPFMFPIKIQYATINVKNEAI